MGSIETGNIISKIRKEKNMTQKELASLLNVSDKAVSKWERGESYPDVALLPVISEILGLSIDELLGSQKVLGGDVLADNKIAYQCLMEDCHLKFEKNWFYIYFLMSLAFFSRFISLPFDLNLIAPIFLPLFIMGLFYFIDRKYQISINRYKKYIDANTSIIDRKPYYQILIVLAVQCFVMFIMTNTTLLYNTINNVEIWIIHSHPSMLFIYLINVITLWVVIIKFSKHINKVNIFIMINLFINFFLCIIMVVFRVYIKLSNPMVKMSVKRLVYPNIIVFVILLVIALLLSFTFLRIKKLSLKGRKILFSISLFENLMLILAFKSVQYVMNDVNNCCFIDNYNIRAIFLIFVVLYYVSTIIYEMSIKNNE